ncbi:7248_t:CDS:2 [Racocetra fulgida]|uniref:7248_t:CDS:1 n=1 Tax=Racocetra fulgida TaxID=60492 RepID=A0A9N9NAZ2_9GLOM|nr:7248_t:CDS:2 [Racocetra fulgida]
MTTEVAEDKKSTTRKRKTDETVERKTNPRRAAKTKAEEAKAAATSSASGSSTTKKTTKKPKTEKGEGPSLPPLKAFLANAQELKVEITQPIGKEGNQSTDNKVKEGEEEKEPANAEAPKNGESSPKEPLFTLTAKPQKHSTGNYGWTASVPKGKIKVEIDGNEVELPVTINFNVTVQGSKK